jgi:hypothetical protein
MLFDLKSLLRSASPVFSASQAGSTSPSSSSVSTSDQYPFPTNPSRVRKARHNNLPQYLPQRNASVQEVQYFLYILLTSRKHDCATKYPEWALETCMAWTGSGGQLRNRTEEQLASLCPITAVAKGIESPKHQLGDYVPITTRIMIGEAITGYVRRKKALEDQPSAVERRWHEEKMRASSAMGRYPSPDVMWDHHSASKTPASRSLSRSRSLHLPDRQDIQYVSDSGSSSWMAPGMGTNNSHITGATMLPVHMYDWTYMLGGRNGPSHASDMHSSTSSVDSVVTQNTAHSSSSQPTANGTSNRTDMASSEQQFHSQQRRKSLYGAREPPINSGRSSPPNSARPEPASTPHPKRPHRYASSHVSPLRTSSTTANNPSTTSSSTMTSGHISTICIVQQYNRLPVRRTSSLATANLIIPETLTEDDENSNSDGDDCLKKDPHDSGVDSSPYGEHSSSTSSPCTSTEPSDTAPTTAVDGLERSLPTAGGPELHHARPTPLSCHTLHMTKKVPRPASVTSNRNARDLPKPKSPSPPAARNSPELVETTPLTNNEGRSTSTENKFVVRSDSLKRMQADYRLKQMEADNPLEQLEVDYQRLRYDHERRQIRFHTLPTQSLCHAQSDTTLYSSPDAVSG